jgi:hypothetical protein
MARTYPLLKFELHDDDLLRYSYEESYGLRQSDRRIESLTFNHVNLVGPSSLSLTFRHDDDVVALKKGQHFTLHFGAYQIFSGRVVTPSIFKGKVTNRVSDRITIPVKGYLTFTDEMKFSLFQNISQAKMTYQLSELLNDVMLGGEFPTAYQPPVGFNYHVAGSTGEIPQINYSSSTINRIDPADDLTVIRSHDQANVHKLLREIRDFANGQRSPSSEQYTHGLDLDNNFYFKPRNGPSNPLLELRHDDPITKDDYTVQVLEVTKSDDTSIEYNEIVVENEILELLDSTQEAARKAHVKKYGSSRQSLNNKVLNMDITTAREWYSGFGAALFEPLKRYLIKLNGDPIFFHSIDGYVTAYRNDHPDAYIIEPLLSSSYTYNASGFFDQTITLGRNRPSLAIRAEILAIGDTDSPTVSLLTVRESALEKTYTQVKNPFYIACKARDDTSVSDVQFYLSKLQTTIDATIQTDGTTTSFTSNDLIGYGDDTLAGYDVEVYSGTGIGQRRTIKNNTSTTGYIVIESTGEFEPFDVILTNGSKVTLTRWSHPDDTAQNWKNIGYGLKLEAGTTGIHSEDYYEYTNNENVTGAADDGTIDTLIDAALVQSSTDYWKGHKIEITSGLAIGDKRIIIAFDPATDKITTDGFSQEISAGNTYKIYAANGYYDLEKAGGLTPGDIFRIKSTATDPSGNIGEKIGEFQLGFEVPTLQLSITQKDTAESDLLSADVVQVNRETFNLSIKTEDKTTKEIIVTYHDGTQQRVFKLSDSPATIEAVAGVEGIYKLVNDQTTPLAVSHYEIKVEATNIHGVTREDAAYILPEPTVVSGPELSIAQADDNVVENDIPTFSRKAFSENDDIDFIFTQQNDFEVIDPASDPLTYARIYYKGLPSNATSIGNNQWRVRMSAASIDLGVQTFYAKTKSFLKYRDSEGVTVEKYITRTGTIKKIKVVSAGNALTDRVPLAEIKFIEPWTDGLDSGTSETRFFVDSEAPDGSGVGGMFHTMDNTVLPSPVWNRQGGDPTGTPNNQFFVNNDNTSESFTYLGFKTGGASSTWCFLRYNGTVLQASVSGITGPYQDLVSGISTAIGQSGVTLTVDVSGELIFNDGVNDLLKVTDTGEVIAYSDIVPNSDYDATLGYNDKRFAEGYIGSLYVEDIIFSDDGGATEVGKLELDTINDQVVPHKFAIGFMDG